jgi:hypothetical protein
MAVAGCRKKKWLSSIVGFHIGERNQESALGLWLSIPAALRAKALVFTDDLAIYAAVFEKGDGRQEAHHQDRTIEQHLAPTL